MKELVESELCWSGPGFLKEDDSMLLETEVEMGSKEEDRKQVIKSISMLSLNKCDQEIWRLHPTRHSCLQKLVRIRAWMQRFLSNCRLKAGDRKSGELTAGEIQETEEDIIREAQQVAFPNEYQALVNGRV